MPDHVVEGADTNMEDAPSANAAMDGPEQSQSGDEDEADEGTADPDAQTTVTDFLDFTEYLPSDIMRSLTLIGNLDQNYADASNRIHDLTTKWGQLPSLASDERPSPVQLRADISEQLNQAVSSRVFAHAEALRMAENVGRHYNKAKFLLSKLQTMMDNYPTEEEQQKSPIAARSPTATRKMGSKTDGDGPQRRKPRIPKITVPGEVLAPYDIEYDTFSDGSDISSDDDEIIPVNRRTPTATPRIKLTVGNKPPKSANRRPPPQTPAPSAEELAAHHAALLRPPPPDAVIGSSDAPWLQLTEYELARLRKRMKKNATWTPSETMVARELRALGRGPEDYKDAKKKAEEEGETFDPAIPAPVAEDSSGAQQFPTGAISADSVAAEEVPTSNRGMKLNEAKKLKREAQLKLVADETDTPAKKLTETASPSDDVKDAKSTHGRNNPRANSKRKRGQDSDAGSEAMEADDTPSARPQAKRTKTETPVPPPQLGRFAQNNIHKSEASASASRHSAGGAPRTQTPVPVPVPRHSTRAAASTAPNTPSNNGQTVTTSVPTKPPGTQTPVPLPRTDRRKSTTPIVPPTRELPKRETRGVSGQANTQDATEPNQQAQPTVEPPSRRSSSRGPNPAKTNPAPDSSGPRRPGSRGKALSQEPQALERPRRASTARNTPIPETRPPSRRAKRPAPGVVSTTISGGSAAVGKRKAAPKKKARAKKEDQSNEVEMEEVDDEGNPIDPDEPRYCLCNRVSFGTMISCDNVDVRDTLDFLSTHQVSHYLNMPLTELQNCRLEWFHLECVGLDNIPARTTKWYCPDCRKALGLGEKGEVSARGVKK